jgi:hypothetical protein
MPKRVSSRRAVKTSMRVGNWASLARASRAARPRRPPLRGRLSAAYLNKRISSISRTIETKENQWRTQVDYGYFHNSLAVINDLNGNPLNIFSMGQGTGDNGNANSAANNRIGDQITVKGVMFKLFLENALNRPRVFYDIMLIRAAKGDTITTATLFKGNAGNKMIDLIDRERFSVVARKRFTISASNPTASISSVPSGAPEELEVGGLFNAGMATKTVNIYVPGRKFGRGGNVNYENGSNTQLKFFDYRWVMMVYDWYGTPTTSIVGRINEGYVKIYFKDA